MFVSVSRSLYIYNSIYLYHIIYIRFYIHTILEVYSIFRHNQTQTEIFQNDILWSESKLENPTFMMFLESKGNTSPSCCGVQAPMAGSFGDVKWWDPFATPTQCHAQINKPLAVNLRFTLEIVFYTI